MNARHLSGVIGTLLLAAPLGACGEAEQPAVCDDVDALRTSLASLEAFNIYDTNVLADLSVVLDQIREQVQQLGQDASAEYADEIDAVQATTDDLQSSAEEAVGAPTDANLSELSTDVSAFRTAFEQLGAAVADSC